MTAVAADAVCCHCRQDELLVENHHHPPGSRVQHSDNAQRHHTWELSARGGESFSNTNYSRDCAAFLTRTCFAAKPRCCPRPFHGTRQGRVVTDTSEKVAARREGRGGTDGGDAVRREDASRDTTGYGTDEKCPHGCCCSCCWTTWFLPWSSPRVRRSHGKRQAAQALRLR